MTVKLLTEHHFGCLILKGSRTGLSKSALVKMLHCLKSYVAAQLVHETYPHESLLNQSTHVSEWAANHTL